MSVMVAMSGGVDSSVAAALLVQTHGVDAVVGVTLRLQAACGGQDSIAAAREVALALGISHHVLDLHQAFEQRVLRPAWSDYSQGRTPNPCVLCNATIKFGLLQEHGGRLGATLLATGHHARIEALPDGSTGLFRGQDPDKDQSYFLFALSPAQLAATTLPVGHLTKAGVRAVARELGLPGAKRPESQDACFTGEQGFAEALRQRFGGQSPVGSILDAEGRVLGQHGGIHRFTIGQRRGLGVATGRRAWVSSIDARSGAVKLNSDEAGLQASGLLASSLRWLARPTGPFEALAQIRYRHRAVPARVEVLDHEQQAIVQFREPQRAVTPGQAVVFYDADRVLGGGWIRQAL